jgi:DNA-binding HxlR family transcriptional regulator
MRRIIVNHLHFASDLLLKCKHLKSYFTMPKAKASTRPLKAPPPPSHRSPCPVSCVLDLFGDRWTLLVIRDLMLGRSRFKDFASSPEGIPTNILSDRLERLLDASIVRQIPATDNGKRMAYELTEKGEALRPILKSMRDWGLNWEAGTQVLLQQS